MRRESNSKNFSGGCNRPSKMRASIAKSDPPSFKIRWFTLSLFTLHSGRPTYICTHDMGRVSHELHLVWLVVLCPTPLESVFQRRCAPQIKMLSGETHESVFRLTSEIVMKAPLSLLWGCAEILGRAYPERSIVSPSEQHLSVQMDIPRKLQ